MDGEFGAKPKLEIDQTALNPCLERHIDDFNYLRGLYSKFGMIYWPVRCVIGRNVLKKVADFPIRAAKHIKGFDCTATITAQDHSYTWNLKREKLDWYACDACHHGSGRGWSSGHLPSLFWLASCQ